MCMGIMLWHDRKRAHRSLQPYEATRVKIMRFRAQIRGWWGRCVMCSGISPWIFRRPEAKLCRAEGASSRT